MYNREAVYEYAKKWAYGRNPILELNENTTIAIAKEKYIYLLDTNFFIIVIC